MTLDYCKHTLDDRFRRIVNELGRLPDEAELHEVPYFSTLLDDVVSQHGSFDAYVSQFSGMLYTSRIPFPSPHQLHTIASIVERERIIIGDDPGTRKTASAGLAKYALEKKIGQKLKTVVVSPGYLISNWIMKLEEYLVEEPQYCVITAQDRVEDLARAAKDDIDFVFVSYDTLYKHLEGNGEEGDRDIIDMQADVLCDLYRGNPAGALGHLRNLAPHKDLKAEWGVTEDSRLEDICCAAAFEAWEQAPDTKPTVCSELIRILTRNDADETTRHNFYLIADEFHNVRDSDLKKKTEAFYRLGLRARFAAFLSGTKTPDDISNIAVVASILDHERFPSPQDFVTAFGNNPAAVRRFYAQHEKRPRLTSEEISGLTIPATEEVSFTLNDAEQTTYLTIQNAREIDEALKLLLLRYATTDARLVHPSRYRAGSRMHRMLSDSFRESPDLLIAVQDTVPSRFAALESLVQNIPDNDKFIVFSKFSKDVTEPLQRFLIDNGSTVLRIDQSVSPENAKIRLASDEIARLKTKGLYNGQKFRVDLKRSEKELLGLSGKRVLHYSERDKVVLEFQTNPDVDGIVATYGTLREGRDLHAANHVIKFDREYQPGVERQAVGRAAGRSGQKKECRIYELQGSGTVDGGIARHITRKEENIETAESLSGVLSLEDALSISGRVRPHRERDIRPYLFTSTQIVRMLFGMLTGGGVEAMDDLIAHGYGELFAANFNHRWETGVSANRGRLISLAMQQMRKDFSEIVELGSGPAHLARIIQRPTTCVDYVEEQLKYGRQACAQLGFEIVAHKGLIHNLHFLRDRSYDLSVTSNVYNLMTQRERVAAVKENKRILREGATGIWIFPPSAIGDDTDVMDTLKRDFCAAGFDVDPVLTGRYVVGTAVDPTTGRTTTDDVTHLMLVGQNTGHGSVTEDMFSLYLDYTYAHGAKNNRVVPLGSMSVASVPEQKQEVCLAFRNIDTNLELRSKVDVASLLRAKIRSGEISYDGALALIDEMIRGGGA